MFSRTYAIQPLSIFFNTINLNNFFFWSYLDNSNDVEPIDNEDDPNLLIEQGMNGNDAKHDAAFIRQKRSDLSSEAQRQAKTFISLYLSISILIYENYTRCFFFHFHRYSIYQLGKPFSQFSIKLQIFRKFKQAWLKIHSDIM
jgi:hypothetical protein